MNLFVALHVEEPPVACSLTARKHGLAGKNPIAVGNFQWIFALDCEGTE